MSGLMMQHTGNVRNIYFPFDIESDTAMDVATEMVAELNITDYVVTQIAELIDGEVSSLVSKWQPGLVIGEISGYVMPPKYEPDVSTVNSILSCLSTSNESGTEKLNSTSENVDCALHGRFGEITYHIKDSESCAQGASILSSSRTDAFFQPNLNEDDRINDRSGRIYDHEEPRLENFQMETDDQNEITGLSLSVYKPMKSFHLGRNFSFRIPSNDDVHSDGNINEKSTENVNISPEHNIEERRL